MAGDWRPQTRKRQKLRLLLRHWWPDEAVAQPGYAVAGCHRWRALDEFPELREHVRLAVPGVKELPMPKETPAQSSSARWCPPRTAVTLGQAGYLARPLRQVSLARHCWLACVRGAIRCLVIPRQDGGPGRGNSDCSMEWKEEDSKGRRLWELDPLNPDLVRFPGASKAGALVCDLKEGEILVVPSGCLLWTEHLWASLAVHHAFVTNDNVLQFQQWAVHHRLSNGRQETS